jgi:hypothetical protein
MALFQSVANALKVLAVGHRVRVTLRPETGRFPNPIDGQITAKDEAGNMSLKSDQGIVQVRAEHILSITRMPG